jgi:hypothetical protein
MSVFSQDSRLRMTLQKNWKFVVMVLILCAVLFYDSYGTVNTSSPR